MKLGRRLVSRSRNTCYGINNHRICFDQALFQQWCNCKRRSRRIAAGIGYEFRSFNLFSKKLRQTEHGVFEIFGVGVLYVVLFINRNVFEPIVGAEIDYF